MSDEYRDLESQLNRMKERIERLVTIKGSMVAEIESIIAAAETDIQALQLKLDALRYEGDNSSNGHGRRKDDQ